jgi:hypothetical protein
VKLWTGLNWLRIQTIDKYGKEEQTRFKRVPVPEKYHPKCRKLKVIVAQQTDLNSFL